VYCTETDVQIKISTKTAAPLMRKCNIWCCARIICKSEP